MIETIKKIILSFFLILAGVTISSTIFITIFLPEIQFSISLLWQFIIMSFVCAFGNFIFYSKREYGKRQMFIRMICHYLYINLLVLGGAFYWKWLKPGFLTELLVMFLMVGLVYIGVMIFNLCTEKKTAETLNKKISIINSEDEDEK